MNSKPQKPGPKPTPLGLLLLWENEWYWVFYGLAYGAGDVDDRREYFEPPRPPRHTGIEELDRERSKSFNIREKQPNAWKRARYLVRRQRIPPEADVWEKLKVANSEAEVREACQASAYWLNAENSPRPFVAKLLQHPEELLKAKLYRYPKSERPTSELKRMIHFARALAGTMEGIGGARAIDLIRHMNHRLKTCPCLKCALERSQELLPKQDAAL